MSRDLEGRLQLGDRLVAEASQMALAAYSDPKLRIDRKGPGDVVSEADLAIERHVRAAILDPFAGDAIIGEEFGGDPDGSRFCWLIDPIDGTVNFARKLGYFCVSLALVEDGAVVAGWVADPLQGEVFSAGPDGVARLGGRPISCRRDPDPSEALVGLGISSRHDRSLGAAMVGAVLATGAEYRRLGAGALCLAHVAAGRLDAYLEPHMNPWDAVGGSYIAACAGAVVNDYIAAGGLTGGAPVFAANPALSETLLAVLPDPFSGAPLLRSSNGGSPGELRLDRKPNPTVETTP